jgi:tRNA (Thr-GGU) A37 N-methylase
LASFVAVVRSPRTTTGAGVEGLDLYVADLDAIDGTPALDVKAWMAEFGPRGEVRQPDWGRRTHALLLLGFDP